MWQGEHRYGNWTTELRLSQTGWRVSAITGNIQALGAAASKAKMKPVSKLSADCLSWPWWAVSTYCHKECHSNWTDCCCVRAARHRRLVVWGTPKRCSQHPSPPGEEHCTASWSSCRGCGLSKLAVTLLSLMSKRQACWTCWDWGKAIFGRRVSTGFPFILSAYRGKHSQVLMSW